MATGLGVTTVVGAVFGVVVEVVTGAGVVTGGAVVVTLGAAVEVGSGVAASAETGEGPKEVTASANETPRATVTAG
jgi:hypothetical protein